MQILSKNHTRGFGAYGGHGEQYEHNQGNALEKPINMGFWLNPRGGGVGGALGAQPLLTGFFIALN